MTNRAERRREQRKGKPDLQKAQRLMREGLKRVAIECDIRYDPATFIVLMMAATSAVIAECCSSDFIMSDDSMEEIVRYSQKAIAEQMRRDLTWRRDYEAAQRRH